MRKICRIAVILISCFGMLLLLHGCNRQQKEQRATAYADPDSGINPQQTPVETEPVEIGMSQTGSESEQSQSQSYIFLFFSDMQADPDVGEYSGLGELAAQALMNREAPDLVIIGGDSVNDGGDEEEWRLFHDATGEWFGESTTASVAGNHDSYALLAEQFDYPSEAPARPGKGYFYTLSVDPVYLIMLDSTIMGAANESDIKWLQDVLESDAARRADWIIAVTHHPIWPVTDNPKDEQRAETMRDHFLPLLEEFGVALILCGHQHVYSRTLPMSGNEAAANGRGIVQVMAASGDKPTYVLGDRSYIAAYAPAQNFVVLSADSESLVITAYDEEGNIIDEFTIIR